MKNIITALVLCGGLLSASDNFIIVDRGVVENITTAKVQALAATEQKEYVKVKVKDGGVERTILVEKKESVKEVNLVNSASEQKSSELDKLNSKVGFIVKFKDNISDIDAFMAKFDIKLKEKLSIGYYIFENTSNDSDIVLMQNILSDEIANKIDTIRVNWPMDVSIE